MRDYRALLAEDRCWDSSTEALFRAHGEPLEDVILQNREELIALCELIERCAIRSYLEVGIWTGRLLSTLHRIFQFDCVAACDHGWARSLGLPMDVPAETRFFQGDTASDSYPSWLRDLGSIDLVMLDADHRLGALRRDFRIHRVVPHRFIAIHDICGARAATRDVKRFWDELDGGTKLEIIRPHVELGLDGSTMGIGIWSATEAL